MNNQRLSTSDVAKLLGISRIAVFKRIKSGNIKAHKPGRNFVIFKKDLPMALENILTRNKKLSIEESIKRTLKEYSVALKLLGKE